MPNFSINANVIAPRLIWVTPQKVLGGDLALHTIVPLVDLEVEAGSRRQRKTGLGDIVVGRSAGLPPQRELHSIVALIPDPPTGRYDKNDLANIGTNHWAVELVYAVSYVQPKGVVADAKIGDIFNQRNS